MTYPVEVMHMVRENDTLDLAEGYEAFVYIEAESGVVHGGCYVSSGVWEKLGRPDSLRVIFILEGAG